MLKDTIKQIIKRKGLKQKIIAQAVGLSEQQFSDLLNGRKMFTSEYIVPIAKALEVTPNELFEAEAAQ